MKFSSILKRVSILLIATFISGINAYAIPVNEFEPNDTNITTNPLVDGESGTGKIASGPEFDGWILQGIHGGDLLFALLSSTADNGDPILSGYYSNSIDNTSNSNIYNDDGGPRALGFNDSLFGGEPLTNTGSLYLRVDGFGSSTLNPYELFQTVVSPNEILPEIEPNDSVATAMPIKSPAILANGSSNADFYSFYANAGERIVVFINQDPGRPTPSSLFVANVTLLAPDGVTNLAPAPGTFNNGPNTTVAIGIGAVPAPTTGTYFVKVVKDTVNPANIDDQYQIAVLVEGATPLVGGCCNGTSCSLFSGPNCRGHFSGVGSSCVGDTDGDGVPNDCDNCSTVGNLDQVDFDGDDFGNACEECTTDPFKITGGACGCGIQDTDSDGDGRANCVDACPADSFKTAPGACGCGVSDADANHNSAIDCLAGPEVKALVTTARSTLKKIKVLSGGASAKDVKARAAKIKALKSLLKEIQSRVSTSAAQITTQAGFNLTSQVNAFAKLVNKTLKSSSSTFSANQKKAAALGSKIIKAITA